MKKVKSVQFVRVLSAAEGGVLSKLLVKGSWLTILQGKFSSWHSCGFYADICNPSKNYWTSCVPPWCYHTPPCHGMIHSGMVRGTWQIAQGSDLASELPRSQSNRAITLEPAPRSHPKRPRGSSVNVLLTGSTGHTERSMSGFSWVRAWWTEGNARQELWMWRLELEYSCWQRSVINRNMWDADRINMRDVRFWWAWKVTESIPPPGTTTNWSNCFCNCRTWLTHRCERVTHSYNNCNWEVGNFYIILLLQQWFPTYGVISVLW